MLDCLSANLQSKYLVIFVLPGIVSLRTWRENLDARCSLHSTIRVRNFIERDLVDA